MELESVDLEKAVVSLLDNNIIKIHVKEHALVELEDIEKIQEVKKSFIGNAVHCVLFIAPRIGTLTKEAREFSATPEVNLNAKAKAIVVPNLGMRLISNFFITMNKPTVTPKIFSNEKEALVWLNEM